jgi:hypothetical protein
MISWKNMNKSNLRLNYRPSTALGRGPEKYQDNSGHKNESMAGDLNSGSPG